MEIQCPYCVWWVGADDMMPELGGKPTCLAFFPEQIPDAILDGTVEHNKPYPGQRNKKVFKYMQQEKGT